MPSTAIAVGPRDLATAESVMPFEITSLRSGKMPVAMRFFARSLLHRRSRNQNPSLQKRTRNTRRVISTRLSPVTRHWFTEVSGTQICFTILETRIFARAILVARF